MKNAIFWFRQDLRLSDNAALASALDQSDHIIPVYILDTRNLAREHYGIRRTGPYRLKFLGECLADLRDALRARGSELVFYSGIPEEMIPGIAAQWDCKTVFAAKAYADEEIRVEQHLQRQIDLRLFHDMPMYHPDDLNFTPDKTPHVFTSFRKKLEKFSHVRTPIQAPAEIPAPPGLVPGLYEEDLPGSDVPAVDPRRAISFLGGSGAAHARLQHYIWESEALSRYKYTRNGLLGEDYSSKFSPWLAFGCISARQIHDAVTQYEATVKKNVSTYWMKFELIWRDFFKYTTMKHGRSIFFSGGISGRSRAWSLDRKAFRAWCAGRTGDDFVDANMRELLFTGFMSNRGRQNVASYLVHDLGQDWRAGAAWFESLLIDYDVESNYGNWMYVAGVGNDPRNRKFNTRFQAEKYDKNGAYRAQWLTQQPDPDTFIDTWL